MATQGIPLAGVRNARELGGYRIGDRTVRKGVLLRSGSLGEATEEAKAILTGRFRLQTIVDLRMSEETARDPDPILDGVRNLKLPMLETADMDAPDPAFAAAMADPALDAMAKFEMVYQKRVVDDRLYVDFLRKERGKAALRGFFEALLKLDPGRAILWHCKDGKDRTGLASAMLLTALGADRESVLADYMLTNTFNKDLVSRAKQTADQLHFPPDKAQLFLFMTGGVLRDLMEKALDDLDAAYGSAVCYLEKEIGIDEEKRNRLRLKFLV